MTTIDLHAVNPVYLASFPTVLQRLRVARGLSQIALARVAGFDHSYLSRLERGNRKPTHQAVLMLSHALACTEPEEESLLVAAGFYPARGGLSIDADLLTLSEALHDPALPEGYRQSVRDSVAALLRGCEAVRGPRVVAVRGREAA